MHSREHDVIALIIKSIITLLISLAMSELDVSVWKKISGWDEGENIFQSMQRTTTRPVETVYIALMLVSLIMIIKYSQLELAGNLHYPTAILSSCSFLLVALSLFLKLTGQAIESV